jgi:antitoxin MazE
MDLPIAKWGNSLALRLPAEIVRRFRLREGDTVDARITVDGALSIKPAHWRRADFAAELGLARAAMPMGSSVTEELRRGSRY